MAQQTEKTRFVQRNSEAPKSHRKNDCVGEDSLTAGGTKGRSILICISWLALKKRPIAAKTCAIPFTLFLREKILLVIKRLYYKLKRHFRFYVALTNVHDFFAFYDPNISVCSEPNKTAQKSAKICHRHLKSKIAGFFVLFHNHLESEKPRRLAHSECFNQSIILLVDDSVTGAENHLPCGSKHYVPSHLERYQWQTD